MRADALIEEVFDRKGDSAEEVVVGEQVVVVQVQLHLARPRHQLEAERLAPARVERARYARRLEARLAAVEHAVGIGAPVVVHRRQVARLDHRHLQLGLRQVARQVVAQVPLDQHERLEGCCAVRGGREFEETLRGIAQPRDPVLHLLGRFGGAEEGRHAHVLQVVDGEAVPAFQLVLHDAEVAAAQLDAPAHAALGARLHIVEGVTQEHKPPPLPIRPTAMVAATLPQPALLHDRCAAAGVHVKVASHLGRYCAGPSGRV